jgi:alkylation response protein AidB-like acyl-CoA dehydrogenase
MNFELSDEQSLLRDSVARFVSQHYSLEQRRQVMQHEHGYSPAHWRTMAELGWLAVPFAEADGGLGGSLIDVMVIMEQFGAGLVLEPFLASIVLGGAALRHGASAEMKREWLAAVMDGSKQLAFAHAEPQARFDLQHVTARAVPMGDDFVLEGMKSYVWNAASAAAFIVSARTRGAVAEHDGITLFLVERDRPGIGLHRYPSVDGGRAADLSLQSVRLPRSSVIGQAHQGASIVAAVANEAILALAAEAVGAMHALYRDTVQYTQQRRQFGHPLADFQVLQHRMVDMFSEYELARSLLYRATMEAVQLAGAPQGAPQAQRTLHALKYLVGRAGMFIAESAVQLHGGMGMTEELRVGHYLKRMLIIDLMFGNSEHHLQLFAA